MDEFIEKAFVWVYSLRFHFQRLGFVSIDNYVIENNLFATIKKALQPKQVLKFTLEQLPEKTDVEKFSADDSRRMDSKILEFFNVNGYYANQ